MLRAIVVVGHLRRRHCHACGDIDGAYAWSPGAGVLDWPAWGIPPAGLSVPSSGRRDTPAAKILVVDDDPLVRDFLHDALVAAGYSVVTAGDALAGLGLAQTEEIAFILMDQNMPRMTGLEAVRRLREDPRTRDVPVALMTGGTAVRASEARAAGCIAYLTKPVSLPALHEVLVSALGNPGA
jgi:CheY-like chemotaxis protein